MIKRITALTLSVALVAASAFAQEDVGGVRPPFCLDPALDGTLLGTSVGLNGAVFYLDDVAELNHIGFGDRVYDSSMVNGLDRFLMNPYSGGLSDVGTYLSVASMLTPGLLVLALSDEWLTIGTMYAETILMAYGLKELGKLCVNQPRPYMYYGDYPQDGLDGGDWSDSFPSGHTTLAFGTAAFRIASGDHFLTDVMAGAAIGTACGFFVPWLHTLGADVDRNMTVQATPTGMLVSIKS